MIIGGIVEIVVGVAAENRSLESIAAPLTSVAARAGGRAPRAAHAH
jgi:hypothetical protein